MNPTIYEKKWLIKFGDADPQGFVYFAKVLELAHATLEKFWQENSHGWSFWFKNPSFAVPIRHAECDYLKPMQAGHAYTARLSVKEVRDSSVVFTCEFLAPTASAEGVESADERAVCARATTAHVFVDRASFEKISVPVEIRRALTIK